MALTRAALRLYLVTDPVLCAAEGLVSVVTAALRGGVSMVQLRDKGASTARRVEAALALKQALAGSGVPLVIDDDVEAAVLADVDGVHLGQDDMPLAEARRRLGLDKIIGLSCETADHVRAPDPALVDYLGLGTVFSTPSKPDHKAAIGLSGLAQLAGGTALPSVAIGGLKPGHAAGVLAAGCDGMAVVSAICGQPDPEAAARRLRAALDAATGDRR
ncbi:thiamine phosphate synthase [Pseudoroseicyclus aestuarii]|uniref:Thiamine-phosphate synthase n=1 Tax=Pseudoroseicyclus aestuarii TaxID=1795041 RepID=A0A318SY66_9RHOB|nr:thiamine phosphate synthase [Pseudoroseicyclus aestuarii]PYE85349.1 thiamine-phosphate diphosphorylase [Pseudoroseicyclus aestuarii]